MFSLIRGSRSRRKARLHGRTYTGVHDVNRSGMWRRRTVPPTQSLDLPTPPYLSVNLINSIQLDLTGVGPMRLERGRRAAYLHSRFATGHRNMYHAPCVLNKYRTIDFDFASKRLRNCFAQLFCAFEVMELSVCQ